MRRYPMKMTFRYLHFDTCHLRHLLVVLSSLQPRSSSYGLILPSDLKA